MTLPTRVIFAGILLAGISGAAAASHRPSTANSSSTTSPGTVPDLQQGNVFAGTIFDQSAHKPEIAMPAEIHVSVDESGTRADIRSLREDVKLIGWSLFALILALAASAYAALLLLGRSRLLLAKTDEFPRQFWKSFADISFPPELKELLTKIEQLSNAMETAVLSTEDVADIRQLARAVSEAANSNKLGWFSNAREAVNALRFAAKFVEKRARSEHDPSIKAVLDEILAVTRGLESKFNAFQGPASDKLDDDPPEEKQEGKQEDKDPEPELAEEAVGLHQILDPQILLSRTWPPNVSFADAFDLSLGDFWSRYEQRNPERCGSPKTQVEMHAARMFLATDSTAWRNIPSDPAQVYQTLLDRLGLQAKVMLPGDDRNANKPPEKYWYELELNQQSPGYSIKKTRFPGILNLSDNRYILRVGVRIS
jgi:hypothetical protein